MQEGTYVEGALRVVWLYGTMGPRRAIGDTLSSNAFWLLPAVVLAVPKYIVPAVLAGAMARVRAQRADAEMAVTGLRARTVMAGLFWAGAWPAVVLSVSFLWAPLIVYRELDRPDVRELFIGQSILPLCVTLNAAAVALVASLVAQRSYTAVVGAIASVWGVEALLRLASAYVLVQSHASFVLGPVACCVRLVSAAVAFWLACRIWRGADWRATAAGAAAWAGVLIAATVLAPGPLTRAAVAHFTGQLSHGSREDRMRAALLLGRLGQAADPSIPALTESLHDANEDVRMAAAVSLAELGAAPEAAVAGLARAVELLDDESRWKAAAALGEMGPRAAAAVPKLTECLGSRDPHARLAAVRTLGEIGRPAAKALPEIRKLQNDLFPDVRAAAQEAVARIEAATDEGGGPPDSARSEDRPPTDVHPSGSGPPGPALR
jgi:hypothetical protein